MLRVNQSRKYTSSSMQIWSLFLIFIFSFSAHADWYWTPASEANLYDAPNEKSDVTETLEEGERVLITKLQKSKSTEWVTLVIFDEDTEETKTVFVTKRVLGMGTLKSVKRIEAEGEREFKSNIGIGAVLSSTIRGPISKDASGGQTVEYGAQLGFAFYPTLHYEFPSNDRIYRVFGSYRLSKSQGESAIKLNGSLSSQEIVTQTMSFMSLGFMSREKPTPRSNYWWGYGLEVAKAIEGKQVYTDGTSVDLKDSLPTNVYLQGSLGYQTYPPQSSQWLPEARVGITFNNKPVTLTGELFLIWIKAL